MSRITRISRLHDYGVFQNFKWPTDLPEFARYNLIYGWNGTGKTTLSRLLRDLELGRSPTMGTAILHIDGNDVSGYDFPQSTLDVRVFNRDFVSESVFPVEGDDIPPILVVGVESVEKQREIERLKRRCESAQMELEAAQYVEQEAEKKIDQFCKRRAKFIKDTLRTSDPGRYDYYNKTRFRNNAGRMVDAGDRDARLLTDSQHRSLSALHQGRSEPMIPELRYVFPDFAAIAERLRKLLATTVVSATIDALKEDKPLSDWIHQGLRLHRERGAERCLFSDQPLTVQRLEDLNAHFNPEYKRLMQRIDQEIAGLEAASDVLERIQVPSSANLYEHLVSDFHFCSGRLMEALSTTRRFLSAAVWVLKAKRRQAFEEIDFDLRPPPVGRNVVERLNTVIKIHNEESYAFERRRETRGRQLVEHMIAERLGEFINHQSEVDSAGADLKAKKQRVEDLNAKITELERKIVEYRQPAEELNEDLRRYLGHGEICLEIKQTGYTITRRGVPVRTVSEGERTMIALLYFLKSLQDSRFDHEDGVVVLDDPVSGLDSNALFSALSFIRECTAEVGQLFVLTHNFFFFRQVHDWFSYLQQSQFFMLKSAHEGHARNNTIRPLDPLLRGYESEYHYLFARIYEAADMASFQGVAEHYVFPNMARRLLEAFLVFRQPQSVGLTRKMEMIAFDESKKRRILRFLNSHPYSIAVGEPGHDLTALSEGPDILRDLLGMMKKLDKEHFMAMEALVETSASPVRQGDETQPWDARW